MTRANRSRSVIASPASNSTTISGTIPYSIANITLENIFTNPEHVGDLDSRSSYVHTTDLLILKTTALDRSLH